MIRGLIDGPSAQMAHDLTLVQQDGVSGGRYSLQAGAQQSLIEAGMDFNPACLDVADDPMYKSLFLATLRDATGDQSIQSCADCKEFCYSNTVSSLQVRQFCPRTCGCHLPNSSLVLYHPDSGCSAACQTLREHQHVFANSPCVDQNLTNSAQFWVEYARQIDILSQDWLLEARQLWRNSSMAMVRLGCDGVSEFVQAVGASLCDLDAIYLKFKPWRLICPVTCGCRHGDPFCPRSCPPKS